MKRLALAVLLCCAAPAAQKSASESFASLSERARKAYEADRAGEAVTLFGRALKLNPRWAEGWWALGWLHYQHDRFPECRDALAQLTRLDPKAAAGWMVRGLCEYRTKQYDLALDHLKRGHMLVEGGGELRQTADYHLALLLTRAGLFETSLEVFMKVARMVKKDDAMTFACGLAALRKPVFPDDVPEADREVVFLAGKAFWDLVTRPPEESKADFEALISRYPAYPNVRYFYATYLAVHKPEDAMGEFLRELKVSPGHVPARTQIALQYLLLGKTDEALKWAKEAVALGPELVPVRLAYGRTLMDAGQEEAALAEFLKAKQLNALSPEVRMYLISAYRALGRTADMAREQKDYERLKAGQKNWP